MVKSEKEMLDSFRTLVLESNGLVKKEDEKKETKEVKAEVKDTKETENKEVVTEETEFSPEEVSKFLAENYGIEIQDETALESLLQFADDFYEVCTETLKEAKEDEEFEVDTEVVSKTLTESYNISIENPEVLDSVVKFVLDYSEFLTGSEKEVK